MKTRFAVAMLAAMALPTLAQNHVVTVPFAPPPSLDALAAGSTSRTEFTFDRSMMQFADKYIAQADAEVKRAAAGLDAITVHTYRFAQGADYDPRALDSVAASYHASGWKHLVNANAKGGSASDVWMHFEGGNINSIAVLIRGDREMTFLSVACTLRPLDLLHLSGHFGIPKMDSSAVMVPAPDGR